MPAVKWIKLSLEIFDDEKIKLIDAMPERDAVFYIWIRLLVLAGKCNEDGKIYLSENIPYTDEMLSTIFNRQINTIRLALDILQKFGMISMNRYQHILINNWGKHQNVIALEDIREKTRKRVASFRERKKKEDKESNVTETLPKSIYAESVKLSEKEYKKLIEKYGEKNIKLAIEKLSNYKVANGKKYKSDYRAILNWVMDAIHAQPRARPTICPDCGKEYLGSCCQKPKGCGWSEGT